MSNYRNEIKVNCEVVTYYSSIANDCFRITCLEQGQFKRFLPTSAKGIRFSNTLKSLLRNLLIQKMKNKVYFILTRNISSRCSKWLFTM